VVLGIDTRLTLLAAGLIFLLALALGVWKYRQMATTENHIGHPYMDIAHRAALLSAMVRDTTNQFEHPDRGLHAGFLYAQFL